MTHKTVANESTILVVEDDPELGEMLQAYFREHGYGIRVVTSGEEALKWVKEAAPNVILMDIHLPGIDGFEVCRRLRKDSRFRQTPVIFLTERRAQGDRLSGLELGAVDYMTKPFDVQELGLRVRNTVERASNAYLTNPITSLPESPITNERLAGMLEQPEWGIVLAGINGLRVFSDSYGFVVADDVIRASGMIVQQIVEASGEYDFLGHANSAEFVIITSVAEAGRLADQCRQRLGATIPYFYPAADWQALQESPETERLTYHIAAITSADGPTTTPEQLHRSLQSTH